MHLLFIRPSFFACSLFFLFVMTCLELGGWRRGIDGREIGSKNCTRWAQNGLNKLVARIEFYPNLDTNSRYTEMARSAMIFFKQKQQLPPTASKRQRPQPSGKHKDSRELPKRVSSVVSRSSITFRCVVSKKGRRILTAVRCETYDIWEWGDRAVFSFIMFEKALIIVLPFIGWVWRCRCWSADCELCRGCDCRWFGQQGGVCCRLLLFSIFTGLPSAILFCPLLLILPLLSWILFQPIQAIRSRRKFYAVALLPFYCVSCLYWLHNPLMITSLMNLSEFPLSLFANNRSINTNQKYSQQRNKPCSTPKSF